jgi:hypothetical protein
MRLSQGLILVTIILATAATAFATTTIPLSEISLSAPVFEAHETESAVEITILRTGGDEYAVDVIFDVTPGTATDPESYIAPELEVVSWAAHDSSARTVVIPLVDNAENEGNKSFSITLTSTNPEAQLSGITTAVINIIDDEHIFLSLTAPTEISVFETETHATFSAVRSGSLVGAASVEYTFIDISTTYNADYNPTGDPLSWLDGEVGPISASVGIVDDGAMEYDEKVLIQLQNPSNGASITVEVERLYYSTHPDHSLSVQVQTADGSAQAGSDYQAVTQVLTWDDTDVSSRYVTINLIDDAFSEGDETFTLSLSNPQGCKLGPNAQTTVTITDGEWTELALATNTTATQMEPATASNAAGEFIVVWDSNHEGQWGVYGRRFDDNGSPLPGSEITLQTALDYSQGNPAVAMNASGMHVVVWIGEWDGSTRIIGRLFDDQGNIIKTVRPEDNSGSTPYTPAVAMDDLGNFMVIWRSWWLGEQAIWARVYDQNGNPYAEDFVVSFDSREENDNPAAAAKPGGGFLVVWEQACFFSCTPGEDQKVVMGKRFDSTGVVINDFKVNDPYTWNMKPRVAAEAGGYKVVWQQKRVMSDGWDIRKCDVVTGPSGRTTVNLYQTGDQTSPAVTIGNDSTIVVWESYGQDGSKLGVFARDLDQSSEHRVNRTTIDDQYDPDVTHLIAGKHLTVWVDKSVYAWDIRGAIWIPESK